MSHTSLPSQTGPMVRMTVRRSGSVLAMSMCRTPAPRSKPSSTTYPVIMMATSQNHTKSTVRLPKSLRHGDRHSLFDPTFRGRAARNFVPDEIEEKDRQHGIESHEAKQGKQSVAGVNVLGISLGRAHEPINQPRLAADFRCQPPSGVGDIGQRQAKH